MKPCIECGAEIIGRSNKKFCCVLCKKKNWDRLNKSKIKEYLKEYRKKYSGWELKICKICGNTFEPNGRSITCSKECSKTNTKNLNALLRKIPINKIKNRISGRKTREKYKDKYREKEKERRKKYTKEKKTKLWAHNFYLRNKEKVYNATKIWQAQNPDKCRKYWQKGAAEMRDYYIIYLLRENGIPTPTKEMIEQKRLQLKITRTIKSIKQKLT